MKFSVLAAAAAVVFGASAASATTLTYYLGDSASYGPSCGNVDAPGSPDEANCEEGGVKLNIRGYEVDTYTGAVNTGNQLDLDELGHYGIGVGDGSGDSTLVDNRGLDEALVLIFDAVVTLEKLMFSYVDREDEVKIGVLSSLGAVANPFTYYDIPGTGVSWLEIGAPVLTGKMFVISTSNDCTDRNNTTAGEDYSGSYTCKDDDAWGLKYVQVSHEETGVVPLPAAGWLMVAGLGGLAAMRRKKKAA